MISWKESELLGSFSEPGSSGIEEYPVEFDLSEYAPEATEDVWLIAGEGGMRAEAGVMGVTGEVVDVVVNDSGR